MTASAIWTGLFLASTLLARDLYLVPASFRMQEAVPLQITVQTGDASEDHQTALGVGGLKNAQLQGKGFRSPLHALHVFAGGVTGQVDVRASGEGILSVETTPQLSEIPADQFSSYLNKEGLAKVIQWRNVNGENAQTGRERYTAYAKSLVLLGTTDGFSTHPLGSALEIVPLTDPFGTRVGSRLPVRVLFQGQPAEGAQVELRFHSGGEKHASVVGSTAADGLIELYITKPGTYQLHTVKMVRCTDTRLADWETSSASLTFEIL